MGKLIDSTIGITNHSVVDTKIRSRKKLVFGPGVEDDQTGLKTFVFADGLGTVFLSGTVSTSAAVAAGEKIIDFDGTNFNEFRIKSTSVRQLLMTTKLSGSTYAPIALEVRDDGIYAKEAIAQNDIIILNNVSYQLDVVVG